MALLRRAPVTLPEDATGSDTSVAVRVDAGCFAGEIALEGLWQGIDCDRPIGHHRLGNAYTLYC
ncbi:hypothetical protein [Nocardia sp.]|uniref:hypothetical protein n=1 Tax=Nocardia sp. TaxID=1821 RepID=UPI002619CCE2|nr:hypothetical protein [Nocardia sp.]